MSITLRPYQTEARYQLNALLNASRHPVFVSPTGTGKCLSAGTPIIMSDGTIMPVEQIRTGDRILGPDSTIRTVTSTTSGTEKMYKVIPEKGDPFVCNESHILSVRMTPSRDFCITPDGVRHGGGDVVSISIKDYLASSKTFKHNAKLWRPNCIIFESTANLPSILPPYLLGLWLGDGSSYDTSFTTADHEVLSYLKKYCAKNGARISVYNDKNCGRAKVYGIAFNDRFSGGRSSVLRSEMKRLNLFKNKHIPLKYKTSSVEERLELLAGLIDTDGCYDSKCVGIEYVSKLSALADDVCFVARSVGLAAYKKTKTVNGTGYYRVTISGNIEKIPCKIQRKRPQKRRCKKNVLNVGFDVSCVGVGEYFGFTIDNDDGLFLLGDFTVAHNTKTTTAIISDRVSIGRRVFVLVPSVEIFTQWITDLSDAGLNPGYINDEGMKGQNRAVYVCMAQSLVNILDRVPEKLWPDELFTDECHHSAASTWETIYTFFDRATRCGLTATPERLDGKGLDHLYTDIVQTITMREAVDAGYLAKPLPIVPQKYLDTHDIPTPDIDSGAGLEAQAAKLGKLEIIGDVLESYRHIFHGKPVLVACATFGHAELMAEKFVEAGWNFEHIHSKLPKQERRRMLRGIRAGTIHGLCTVGIGIEGMDIPGLHGLIWLRRTRSLTIYLQFIGRTLRPLPGKKYGVILDPVGNLFLHGFPESDRTWRLEGRGDDSGRGEPPEVPMRICPWCGVANNPENERCHFCGMQLLDEDGNRVTKKRDLPSFVAGQLIVVTSDGDRQMVEDAIIQDVNEATETKKTEQKEAKVLTSAEKKDILVQGIFAGRERRPLFNEAVRGMVRRGGLD